MDCWFPCDDELPSFDDDVWELYDTTTDWSQARDLAAEMPDKLRELQRLFLIEAVKYSALPLDDRRVERFIPEPAGRSTLIHGDSQLLFGGMGRLSENSLLVVKNKSHSVTADIVAPDGGGEGVLIAQGGAFGGWTLNMLGGKPKYCYNLVGLQRFLVGGESVLAPGPHQVRMEFAYDGGGLGKGGTASLYVDGTKVGEGRLKHTQPIVFSADETADVGRDTGTGVSDEYTAETSRFNGKIDWVQIDVGGEDADHLISPKERLRVA